MLGIMPKLRVWGSGKRLQYKMKKPKVTDILFLKYLGMDPMTSCSCVQMVYSIQVFKQWGMIDCSTIVVLTTFILYYKNNYSGKLAGTVMYLEQVTLPNKDLYQKARFFQVIIVTIVCVPMYTADNYLHHPGGASIGDSTSM